MDGAPRRWNPADGTPNYHTALQDCPPNASALSFHLGLLDAADLESQLQGHVSQGESAPQLAGSANVTALETPVTGGSDGGALLYPTHLANLHSSPNCSTKATWAPKTPEPDVSWPTWQVSASSRAQSGLPTVLLVGPQHQA